MTRDLALAMGVVYSKPNPPSLSDTQQSAPMMIWSAISMSMNRPTSMQQEFQSWVPDFFKTDDYALFVQGDAISWIRLPHGYCRRNPKLPCESDVKCLLCDRYCASPADLPRLHEMHDRFRTLDIPLKANVVQTQIIHLQA